MGKFSIFLPAGPLSLNRFGLILLAVSAQADLSSRAVTWKNREPQRDADLKKRKRTTSRPSA
jgi:hypothetical protein